MTFNWLSIALATVASMVLASVWYQDWAFGKAWKRLTGVDAQKAEQAGNAPMLVVLVVNLVTAVVLSFTLSAVFIHFGHASVWLALATGVVVWLAYSASTLLTHNLFEQKPLQLTAINSGYQLVMFVVMSLILGVM